MSASSASRLALVALLLASCQAAGGAGHAPYIVEARSDEDRVAVLRAAEHLAPQVRDLFGVHGRTEPIQIVWASDTPKDGRVGGESNAFGITLYHSRAQMQNMLAHELVHTYARYTPSPWNTLPLAIEEGIAYIVQTGLEGTKEVVVELTPPQAEIYRVAAASVEQYQGAESGEKIVLSYVGAIIAGGLGMDGLRDLTVRAASEGLDTVPAAWIRDAFGRAMLARNESRSPSAADGSWSFDPLFGTITTDRERTITATLSFHPHEPEEADPKEDYSEANTGN